MILNRTSDLEDTEESAEFWEDLYFDCADDRLSLVDEIYIFSNEETDVIRDYLFILYYLERWEYYKKHPFFYLPVYAVSSLFPVIFGKEITRKLTLPQYPPFISRLGYFREDEDENFPSLYIYDQHLENYPGITITEGDSVGHDEDIFDVGDPQDGEGHEFLLDLDTYYQSTPNFDSAPLVHFNWFNYHGRIFRFIYSPFRIMFLSYPFEIEQEELYDDNIDESYHYSYEDFLGNEDFDETLEEDDFLDEADHHRENLDDDDDEDDIEEDYTTFITQLPPTHISFFSFFFLRLFSFLRNLK